MELAYFETEDKFECECCGGHAFQIRKRSDAIDYPSCCGEQMEKVIDYTPTVIDRTPRTLGTLAEQNTRRMGHFELEQKRREENAQKFSKPLID